MNNKAPRRFYSNIIFVNFKLICLQVYDRCCYISLDPEVLWVISEFKKKFQTTILSTSWVFSQTAFYRGKMICFDYFKSALLKHNCQCNRGRLAFWNYTTVTVLRSFTVVVWGVEAVYEIMWTLWKERQVPSLTLTQHKSRAALAKAHYAAGEIESRFQPSLTPKQCFVSSVEALLMALDNHSSEHCDSWLCQTCHAIFPQIFFFLKDFYFNKEHCSISMGISSWVRKERYFLWGNLSEC